MAKKDIARNQNNIKSTYDLPESNDPEEIRRQVEFYFSDANLPMDKFLLQATGGSENKPFSLKELHTFKRMAHFQPYSAVVEAVKQSKLLDINSKDEVSRKTPLSEEYSDEAHKNRRIYEEKAMPRSIYAKGFGAEDEKTQTKVEEFFAPYGEVVSVRLRRNEDKTFKGSATIEFADEDTAAKFLALETKPLWEGKTKLQFETKKAWAEEKSDYNRSSKNPKHINGRGDKYPDRKNKQRGDRYKPHDKYTPQRSSKRRRDHSEDRGDRRHKSERSDKGDKENAVEPEAKKAKATEESAE